LPPAAALRSSLAPAQGLSPVTVCIRIDTGLGQLGTDTDTQTDIDTVTEAQTQTQTQTQTHTDTNTDTDAY